MTAPELKRYDPESDFSGEYLGMFEKPDGGYVDYEDLSDLLEAAKREARVEAAEKLRTAKKNPRLKGEWYEGYLVGVSDACNMLPMMAADALTALDRAKREARVEGMERVAYCRTGIYDKDGREICVGDHIVIDLTSPGTKKEYWLPEYEVMFKPPHFTLKYIGGGMDSDTARFRFSSPHRENSKTITTIRALIKAEERGKGKPHP